MNIFKPEKTTHAKQKTRKPRLYKQALCLVSILSLMIVQAGAHILRPVPVLASEGAAAYNVAGYILSLLTSYNTAITNQQVVNSIVTTFGNMDCATASAAEIETGLATIAQSTGFDLAPIFATTAEEAAEVAAVYEGWGETAIAAASASTNIEAGARGLALAAAGGAGAAILPAVGGVVIPAAAAVALGVAGGFFIDHLINSVSNYVKAGKSITTPSDELAAVPYANVYRLVNGTGNTYWVTYEYGTRYAQYFANNRCHLVAKNYTNTSKWYRSYNINFTATGSSSAIAAYGWKDGSFSGGVYVNEFPTFSNYTECQNYLNGFNEGIGAPNIATDLLGDNGMQTGQDTDNGYSMPYIYPVYDYGTTVINYITPSDYQEFIAKDPNTGIDFDTFVNPYIQPVPEPEPEPEPTTVPQPTQEPIVGVNPVPDPQPTAAPLPTPSPEEEEQLPEGMTNPSWKEKFPFCIPYDLLEFMQIWQESRSAPRFEFDLSFGTNGRYGLGVVVIDLAPFDSAAQLLRLLQLILFIVGLAIGTHKLLNPSGGGGD